jgi:conjugal transfer pilus assembly protein TraF
LSAEWFRKNLESYRDKALDQPTKENVSAYFWLQRVMLDKAQKFTDAAQMAVVEDPLLDENSRRPIATFGARAIDEMARDSQEKAAAKLANMAGIWFFYESTCKFCEKQAGALMGLHNAHGFKVLPIAIDGLPLPGNPFPDFIPDRGQAKKLGVEMTPAIFLVKPGAEGGVIQIAQSLIAGDEIVQRSIMLAHEKGWLDDTEYQQTIPSRSLVVDTSLGKQVTEQQLQNPADLTEAIRASLRKKIKP